MSSPAPLHRMVSWAHRFLAEALRPGDLAIDLTAGNGADTVFLYECVREEGRVFSFDIQEAALGETEARLRKVGVRVFRSERGETSVRGVHLLLDDHARLGDYCLKDRERPRGIVANLGFRPGGERSLVTRAKSTIPALRAALDLLSPGGRIAVVAYVGHEGGEEEADCVAELFASLPPDPWLTLRMGVPNRPGSPFLLVAEKRRSD